MNNDYFYPIIIITFFMGTFMGVLAFILGGKEKTLKENILKLLKLGIVVGVISALIPLFIILIITGFKFIPILKN